MRADWRLSKPLLYYLVGNICFNSYSFVLLFYAKIETNFRILLAHVVLVQIVFPLIAMFFLSNVNRLICASTSMLFRALLYARFNRLHFDYCVRISEHWKSSTYFEQLNRSNNDIAFTAGLLGVISRRSILEFFLIYFAYMMVFSGKFMEKQ